MDIPQEETDQNLDSFGDVLNVFRWMVTISYDVEPGLEPTYHEIWFHLPIICGGKRS